MKTWHNTKKQFIDTPKEVVDFLNEIDEVCKKHNLSISHEDDHGSFIIAEYNKDNIEWLKNASIK